MGSWLTSDGSGRIEQCEISITNALASSKSESLRNLVLSSEMLDESQFFTCYVMCDEIGNLSSLDVNVSLTKHTAGTMQFAELRPRIPPSKFPARKIEFSTPSTRNLPAASEMNISRRRSRTSSGIRNSPDLVADLLDSELADADLMAAGLPSPWESLI